MQVRNMEQRICKKCLLREGIREDSENYVERYLANLTEEERTEDFVYEERLKICKKCNMLFEAMCRGCGCYVELRAAVRGQKCPYDRWKS